MTKSIFITGAGAGIGRETARLFASKGWFVGAGDLDQPALNDLQAELGESVCSIHVMDVTDEKDVIGALSKFADCTGGTIDALHNNAGILRVGRFECIDIADHRAVIEINVIGLMNVLQAAFPYLKATPGSVVVNMSSASAAYGTPDFASYSASKHAVRALTEALDIEWEAHGIRVCDIMPPFVKTGMVEANAGASQLFSSLGINLKPEDVAREVWEQVRSPRLHRPVSAQFKALWPVARSAPASVTRAVLKKLRQG
ncbi:SDR family oxidoreductase [Marinobacter sp. M216]|uniref:SDR family oxidoreductase n=1 Tax=Marinobacter albus TaxID=3030833 RepID=A0ABT7HBN2_9GAMM|nr:MULTISPECIES: SDR family oxidoreductase [unclassified Marinobacter]MBW7470293.1 SDR family oxidoreductase [Marinobacter sp. F4218]MDK9557442.1 SDR family oxidoreductase [Marinobacter sp. M216]